MMALGTSPLILAATASLSVVGALVMVIIFALVPRLRTFPSRLAVNLAFIDIAWFGSELFNLLAPAIDDGALDLDGMCRWVGPLHQFCGVAIILWTSVLSAHVARLASRQTDLTRARALSPHTEATYHLLVWPLSAIVAMPYVAGSGTFVFDKDTSACGPTSDDVVRRVLTATVPALGGFVTILIGTIYTWRTLKTPDSLRHGAALNGHDKVASPADHVVRSALRYLVAFGVAWLPTVVDEIMAVANPGKEDGDIDDTITTALLFSQGVLHCGIYVWNKRAVITQEVPRSVLCRRCCGRRREHSLLDPSGRFASLPKALLEDDRSRSGSKYSYQRDLSTSSVTSDIQYVAADGGPGYYAASSDDLGIGLGAERIVRTASAGPRGLLAGSPTAGLLGAHYRDVAFPGDEPAYASDRSASTAATDRSAYASMPIPSSHATASAHTLGHVEYPE